MSSLNAIIKSFNIEEIGKILSSISSEDALKILIAAKDGIESSTDIIEKLELTQRRYYLHLNELMKAGLIEKVEDIYQLTTLGKVMYNLGEAFNTTLINRERLDLADRIQRTKTISLDETEQILKALSGKGIIGYSGITDFIQPVKMIDNYDNLVLNIIDLIKKAEKNIYLASYYTDSKVVEAILKAIERGLELHLLSGSKKSIVEKLQLLKMILNPSIINLYFSFLNGGKVKIKTSEFPFSFCVVDEKYVIIELPNPITNSFYLGFSIQNEILAKELIQAFEGLYKEGKDHPLLNQVKVGT
jgi:DNA-binding transcriptional ArsR family regulator